VTPEQLEEAVKIACESLKERRYIWDNVPGYAHARMFGPIKVYSRIRGVLERDGDRLLYDGDGKLVPTFGGSPVGFNIYDDEKGGRLIAKAQDGDQIAHNVLCWVASRFVESGCAFPTQLRAYIAGTLYSQSRKAPRRGRGRDPYANYIRDDDVTRVVRKVVELGFRPTRNRATETESACSIVAQALAKLGIHLSVPAVEKIWSASRKGSARN
jgi:hypothetical protein